MDVLYVGFPKLKKAILIGPRAAMASMREPLPRARYPNGKLWEHPKEIRKRNANRERVARAIALRRHQEALLNPGPFYEVAAPQVPE